MRYHRSSFSITLSVWKALFLREALSRFFSGRVALLWVLAEPLFHVAYIVLLYTVIRVHKIGGIDTALWVVVGLLTFFFFRRTSEQVNGSVRANQALFAYRQVKPIDTIIVRAGLEGLIMCIVALGMLVMLSLLGHDIFPIDPIMVMMAVLGVWLIGLGIGLITSVIDEIAPSLGKILNMMMRPLYLISGVLMPISAVPQPYRDWFLINPLANGVEAARIGFVSNYHAVPGFSMIYLYQFALALVLLGLLLHKRFAVRLVTL